MQTASQNNNVSPATSYQEALTKLTELENQDNNEINPICKTKSLLHGQQTEKVIILYHGFTNCPAQFSLLSQTLYDQGYSVLIPRIKYHGYSNRLTEDLGNLTAQDLTDETNQTIDIASGLGKQVTVFGLSGGGIMAAFGVYYRAEVQSIFLAAPLFLPKQINPKLANLFFNVIDIVPNYFSWWDGTAKENISGPKYAYPRFSTKGLLGFEQLAFKLKNEVVKTEAKNTKKSIVLLVTQNDRAVNNDFVLEAVSDLSKKLEATFTSYQFPKDQNIIHDFVDPNQTEAKIDVTYPKILELLKKAD